MSAETRAAFLGLLLLGVACQPRPSSPGQVHCRSVRDCPRSPEECLQSACSSGVCVFTPVSGPVPDTHVGDCQRATCVKGTLRKLAAPEDIPPEDGNPCTREVCAASGALPAVLEPGTPCGADKVCDGKGACVACVPGQTRCFQNAPETCEPPGTWKSLSPCAGSTPVCSQGHCASLDQLVAGWEHSCALLSDQTVRCWGSAQHGDVGTAASVLPVLVPTAVKSVTGVVQLAAGAGMHTCARLAQGTIQCWGLNDHGQVGSPTIGPSTLPTLVAGLTGAIDVAVGEAHSCAIVATGAVLCWGDNSLGQLGDGTRQDRLSPTRVVGVEGALRVALGNRHSCALLQDHTVRCWGSNSRGEAGLAQQESLATSAGMLKVGGVALTPTHVEGLAAVAELALGERRSCARLEDGTVECWGGGSFQPKPQRVRGLENVTGLRVSGHHSCALLQSGEIRCWGSNEAGQLGEGTRKGRKKALAVQGLEAAKGLATGPEHVCAWLQGGAARCWGSNSNGKLGDRTREPRLVPTLVLW